MYLVSVAEDARAAIAALPIRALSPFAQALDVVESARWAGPPHNALNPSGALRHLLFGDAGSGRSCT